VRGEKLYGRQRETAELLDLLIAERIVLLYSPSGAGKTSLVQAALIPELEAEGFRVLPVMRPGLSPDEAAPDANRYVLSLLLGLERDLPEGGQTDLEELAKLTLEDYLGASCWPGGAWHGTLIRPVRSTR
jgi:ATP/maltotriose-dependent transcriptional regulator MalT